MSCLVFPQVFFKLIHIHIYRIETACIACTLSPGRLTRRYSYPLQLPRPAAQWWCVSPPCVPPATPWCVLLKMRHSLNSYASTGDNIVMCNVYDAISMLSLSMAHLHSQLGLIFVEYLKLCLPVGSSQYQSRLIVTEQRHLHIYV